MDGGNKQAYSVRIEHDLRHEYNCDRIGIGGIADSDHIRNTYGGFYHCMAMVLVKYYFEESKEIIDNFLNDNWDIAEAKLEDLQIDRIKNVLNEYEKVYKQVRNK